MRKRLSLKGRALQLLAQREQSSVELRRKLKAHAVAARRAQQAANANDPSPGADTVDAADAPEAAVQEVEAVMAWLVENAFASDERFVESRVQARSARFGNLRIRNELSQHGLAPDAVLAQQLRDSELERARQVWARKFDRGASDVPPDAAAQARQARFLVARGFSREVIRQVLRQEGRGKSAFDDG